MKNPAHTNPRPFLALTVAFLFLASASLASAAPKVGDETRGEGRPAATAVTSSKCGNGVLEAGESCESCPADCETESCKPSRSRETIEVAVTTPQTQMVTSMAIRLAYRSASLSLPGKAMEPTVKQRIKAAAKDATLHANDLGYALRVILTQTSGIANGKVFTVAFDRCEGIEQVSAADLACAVEGCAGAGGGVQGCTCRVEPAGA